MNNLLLETKKLLKKYKIRPNRRKGQNFIIDYKIIEKQIRFANISNQDIVVEIGAGLGTLTQFLAEISKKVIAIEIDKRLIQILEDRFSTFKNVEIIHGDILDLELPLDFNKIVSNIPYSISSPLTFKILDEMNFIDLAILTYQLDFAKRMIAHPGSKEYSRLSVNVYYKAHVKILEKVPNDSFYPPPKVQSAILELIPRKPPFKVIDEKFFNVITQKLFIRKNRKVKKMLQNYLETKNLSKHEIGLIIKDLPYQDMRVRNLPPEAFAEISNILWSKYSDYIHE